MTRQSGNALAGHVQSGALAPQPPSLGRSLLAYAAALAPLGTEETVFSICEAIW